MIFLSSMSSFVSSSANLFVELFVVGYNDLTVVGSRFSLCILPDLGPVAPNHHLLRCWWLCCCFQVYFWSIIQFTFLSFCVSIHPFPAPEPSGRVLCCTFMEVPDIVCASYLPTLDMCILFLVLG